MNGPLRSGKRERRIVDGVLLVDKPVGPSSNAVLQHVRHLYSAATAGHTGTLDPLASGLLPVCFGDATKFGAHLLEADKGYLADIRLGITTSTADAEGEVLAQKTVPRLTAESPELRTVLSEFVGDILQIPPMYSALKVGGLPLYKLARKGMTTERRPRAIRILKLDLLGFEGETLRVHVLCSKGTYIRTLAEDIGARLGCGAHLASLRRVSVGAIQIADALAVSMLDGMPLEERLRRLMPVDYLVSALRRVDLSTDIAKRFAHGQRVEFPVPIDVEQGTDLVRVFDSDGKFLGVGQVGADRILVPHRLTRQVDDPPSVGAIQGLPN